MLGGGTEFWGTQCFETAPRVTGAVGQWLSGEKINTHKRSAVLRPGSDHDLICTASLNNQTGGSDSKCPMPPDRVMPCKMKTNHLWAMRLSISTTVLIREKAVSKSKGRSEEHTSELQSR